VFCDIFSQNTELTLERSIEIATDSSLQAFRAKNLYLSGYWQYRSFKAERLPSVTLNATPLRYNRHITQRYDSELNQDVYRSQQSFYSYGNLSVQQNFDLTGGTFFIDTELGYLKNIEGNTSQFSSVPFRIGYSQSLFGFNSFKWEKKIEPLRYEKAKRDFLYAREEISETVIQYFFALAMAQKEYEIAQDNLTSADTLYRIGTEKQKIAAIAQADLLTLKLDAVNAKNALKNAETGLKRAMFGFVSCLNLDKNTQVKITLPVRPSNLIISAEEALAFTQKNNPDYLSNRLEHLEAEREVERTKRSSNFDASFSASVGFNQVGNTLRQVYTDPLRQDVVSIGLTIPVLDWGVRKGRANMALNNLNVTKISIQQREIAMEQDVVMTVSDFNIQQDLINSAEEALALANMAYNVNKERFILGKADLSALTLAQNRQNTAQRNYISALRDYWVNYYKLRRLTLYDFFNKQELGGEFFNYELRITNDKK
jgi:outer membrane protein TolC